MHHRVSIVSICLLATLALACATDNPRHTGWRKACSQLNPQQAQRPIRHTEPRYPAEARQLRIEGAVDLALTLDSSGHVAAVEVLHSRPEGVFDEAAIKAVRKWRFCPPSSLSHAYPKPLKTRLGFRLP